MHLDVFHRDQLSDPGVLQAGQDPPFEPQALADRCDVRALSDDFRGAYPLETAPFPVPAPDGPRAIG